MSLLSVSATIPPATQQQHSLIAQLRFESERDRDSEWNDMVNFSLKTIGYGIKRCTVWKTTGCSEDGTRKLGAKSG